MPQSSIKEVRPSSLSQSKWFAVWSLIGLCFFALFIHRAWFIPETDYVAYYNAGKRSFIGTNLYLNDLTPFKYLPFVSYLFIPFSFSSFQISKLTFFLFSFVLGIAAYFQVHRQLGNWCTLAVLAAMIRFHNYDFLNAQVNHVLLILLITYLSLRSSRVILASFFFAILASFKILPLLTLIPLFFLKKFRELSWILIWFCMLNLLPTLTFHDGFHIFSNWLQLMRETTEFPAPSGPILQSLQGALWFWIGPKFSNLIYFSILCITLQVLLIGICSYFAKQCRTKEDEQRVIVSSIIVSVIVSPLAWKHNYLLLLPAFVLLLERKQYRIAFISFFFMTLFAGVVGIFSQHWVDRSYTTLLGALILYFGMFSTFTNTSSKTS